MSDQDLALQGEDVTLTLTVDGAIVDVYDTVVSGSRKMVTDKVETKNLGTDGSKIRRTFVRWEGSLEFAETSLELDKLQNQIAKARRDNAPLVVSLVELARYRNVVVGKHTYPGITLGDFDTSDKRGQARKVTVPWECGSHRITVES